VAKCVKPRANDVPLIKGLINETGNPVATVGVGEADEVGEIFYTKFKQNLDQYRHNKILDVGKYCLHTLETHEYIM
jgi:hypothetical protein